MKTLFTYKLLVGAILTTLLCVVMATMTFADTTINDNLLVSSDTSSVTESDNLGYTWDPSTLTFALTDDLIINAGDHEDGLNFHSGGTADFNGYNLTINTGARGTGIYSNGSLTIKGTGNLTITADVDGIATVGNLSLCSVGDIDIVAGEHGVYSANSTALLSVDGVVSIVSGYGDSWKGIQANKVVIADSSQVWMAGSECAIAATDIVVIAENVTMTTTGYVESDSVIVDENAILNTLVRVEEDDFIYGDFVAAEDVFDLSGYSGTLTFKDGSSLTILAGEADLSDYSAINWGTATVTNNGMLWLAYETDLSQINLVGSGVVLMEPDEPDGTTACYTNQGDALRYVESVMLTDTPVTTDDYIWEEDVDGNWVLTVAENVFIYNLSIAKVADAVIHLENDIYCGMMAVGQDAMLSSDDVLDPPIFTSTNLTITSDASLLVCFGLMVGGDVTIGADSDVAVLGVNTYGDLVVEGALQAICVYASNMTINNGATVMLGTNAFGLVNQELGLLLSGEQTPELTLGNQVTMTTAGRYVTWDVNYGDDVMCYGGILAEGSEVVEDWSNLATRIVFKTNPTYTITVGQTGEGTISPDSVMLYQGESQTYTIEAGDDYKIGDVLVDGESIGAVATYTFENLSANHTLEVVFTADVVADDNTDEDVDTDTDTDVDTDPDEDDAEDVPGTATGDSNSTLPIALSVIAMAGLIVLMKKKVLVK